jgi:hypothetical protein
MGLKKAFDSQKQRHETYQATLVESQHYEVAVNKGSINVGSATRVLNARWAQGWALFKMFEQDGNTVMVFERRDLPPGSEQDEPSESPTGSS